MGQVSSVDVYSQDEVDKIIDESLGKAARYFIKTTNDLLDILEELNKRISELEKK